ncbi:hydroxysqualene dehydroxylase HpnE [Lysobacter humi (ex Lee et al. 2017)]
MQQTDVLIVGGGLAGLACGVALSDAGLRVRVLEASGTLGGRARSWTEPVTGDRVDIGPHILLSAYRNMRGLLERLGTADRVYWQQDKFLTLVDTPHPPVDIRVRRLPPPLHMLPSMLSIPQLSWWDVASNTRLMWRTARLTPQAMDALDDVPALDLLRREGVSERYIDWFWRTACMTVMNAPVEETSSAALLQLFRYLMGVGGYEVGFPKIGLGDLYAPLAQAAIERAGGEVRLRAPACALVDEDGRVVGVRLQDGEVLRARHVVVAVPPHALRDLLPPAWRGRAPFDTLGDFRPSPYVSTYLWFDRPLTNARFWSKVWTPEALNFDFYDLSNIRDDLPRDRALICSNIIDSRRLPPIDDAAIVDATLRELREYLPQAADARLVHADVHRIPMAIPLPLAGSESMRPGVEAPLGGLLLAGDWPHTGLPASMESAVRAARLAAEVVLAREGRPQPLAAPLPQVEGLVGLVGRGRMP